MLTHPAEAPSTNFRLLRLVFCTQLSELWALKQRHFAIMANAVDAGDGRLRDVTGQLCDLCGVECDPQAVICVALSCPRCEDALFYHQVCVEKFLKKHGFPSSRKVGFPCPRGRGKGTKYTDECKGRVEKSHPIIPRNEEKKKKALAPPMSEVLAKQPKPKEAKPPAPARKMAPPKPHQLPSSKPLVVHKPQAHPISPAANAWLRPEGLNSTVKEPAAEPAAVVQEPKGPHVPVGLVLEEALTKAQKKNLQRRKKKQAAAGTDAGSENGTAATDLSLEQSSLDDWAGNDNSAAPGTSAAAEQLLCGGNFIKDPNRYLQILGLLGDDDSDVEDSEGATYEDCLSPSHPANFAGGGSSVNNTVHAGPSTSAAPASAFALPSKDPEAEEAALQEAMAQSLREYELQQEMNRQREILSGMAFGKREQPVSPPAAAAPAFHFPAAPVALAAPSAAPVALPTFNLPVVQPIAAPPPVVVPKQQATPAPAANLVDDSYTYQQQAGQYAWMEQQPHKAHTAATTAMPAYGGSVFGAPAGSYGAAATAAYGVAPVMAAGHAVTAVSADDEDDLSSLLALCGVAG